MAIPVLILLATFLAGVLITARWLPNLDSGRVGRIAFRVVCGLVGIAVALVGLEIYEIARTIDRESQTGYASSNSDVVTAGVVSILQGVGPVIGLPAAVYLLAPSSERIRDEDEYAGEPLA